MWETAGIKTDPAADTILADTGALSLSVVSLSLVFFVPGVGLTVSLEHRNALNTTTLDSQLLYIPGSDASAPMVISVSFLLNERFRVRLVNSVAGDVQVSIFT